MLSPEFVFLSAWVDENIFVFDGCESNSNVDQCVSYHAVNGAEGLLGVRELADTTSAEYSDYTKTWEKSSSADACIGDRQLSRNREVLDSKPSRCASSLWY